MWGESAVMENFCPFSSIAQININKKTFALTGLVVELHKKLITDLVVTVWIYWIDIHNNNNNMTTSSRQTISTFTK